MDEPKFDAAYRKTVRDGRADSRLENRHRLYTQPFYLRTVGYRQMFRSAPLPSSVLLRSILESAQKPLGVGQKGRAGCLQRGNCKVHLHPPTEAENR